MKISAHLEKVVKLEKLRQRLDPSTDFELWFWAGMTAGTHAVNAMLHHAGVTADDDMFPTQPGVYLSRQLDGSLSPAFRAPGDVLHVGRPKIEGPLPEDMRIMMQQMEIVERYRDPCIRGGREPTTETVEECDGALRRCLELLRGRIPEGAP